VEYGEKYDNLQSESKYFRKYLGRITDILIERYGILNKTILEVGCGNGEFLEMLSEKSNSKGIGFDPSYRERRHNPKVRFVPDYLTKEHSPIRSDVLILRHVLEHVAEPRNFLLSLLKHLENDKTCTVVIEIPDFSWIMKNEAYWDIFYEHVNYFSYESLSHLLQSVGMNIIDVLHEFKGQYLIVIASYDSRHINKQETRNTNAAFKSLVENIGRFRKTIKSKDERIDGILGTIGENSPIVVWGAAAKGVTFLNHLGDEVKKRIPFIIDINPSKQGMFCAGTGKKIMPAEILESRTDVNDIIVMNPNYYKEISRQLEMYDRDFNLIMIKEV
jgi:SAM-dependent methyltransferase